MKTKAIIVFSLIVCMICMRVGAVRIIDTSISDATVSVDDELVFSVRADSENVSGMQFTIAYDEEVLSYVKHENTELFQEAIASGINVNNPGSIGVLIGFLDKQNINEEIIKVTFKVIGGGGEESIQVTDIKLSVDNKQVIEEKIKVNFEVEKTQSGGNKRPSSSTGSTGRLPSSKNENTEEIPTVENIEDIPLEKPELQQPDEPFENSAGSVGFYDIIGHWAENSVQNMVSKGIINGYDDGSFKPDTQVKRCEFATMIAKALNLKDMSQNVYQDVADNAWYKDAVLKCTNSGLIQGDAGYFRPDDYISREEMAVIIYRAQINFELLKEAQAEPIVFVDEELISTWAKDAVASLTSNGILNGMDGNYFNPKFSATRAQAVVVLEKTIQ